MNRSAIAGSAVAVAGLALAGWRGALALHWYREWRRIRSFDPSGAELYELNLRIDGTLTLVALAIAALGIWIARRGAGGSR